VARDTDLGDKYVLGWVMIEKRPSVSARPSVRRAASAEIERLHNGSGPNPIVTPDAEC
jgi:hypothetical protein